MTPEERSLLTQTHKLAEENNSILRSLRRSRRISTLLSIFYWVVIIAISVGSYYFIEPYMKMLPNVIGAIQGDVNSANAALQQMKSLQSVLPR
ncbi:MAG: hypothetical protein WCO48_00785 [Candidatus Taylorbacteria bacterium]